MDCSLISSFSVCSQLEYPKSKISKLKLLNEPRNVLMDLPRLRKSLSLHSKFQPKTPLQLGKLHFVSLQFHPFSCMSERHLPPMLTSNPSKIKCPTIQNDFFKTFASKIAVLIFGSLIFMGSLKIRPALAVPATQRSSSVTGEEERDAQGGGSDIEGMFSEILQKDPKNVEALKVALYGKMRKGKTKEAVEYVERLIDIEPNEVEWRLLQALSYEMMGQLNKAKKLFKEILEDRPLLLRALHTPAKFGDIDSDATDDAIVEFFVEDGLAIVMHKNHEGPAIFVMLNKALEVARREKRVTEERNIRILIAQMNLVKGNLDEALKNFQVLIDENPRDFRPYLCQGIIYSLLDKKKEAEENFQTYRSLVPEEFPQRGFLDDVVLAAKTESREQLQKEFETEYSSRK